MVYVVPRAAMLTVSTWVCSAAAVVRRLSAAHSLPAYDVAEALMLYVEACTPHVGEMLAGLQPRQDPVAVAQRSERSAPGSSCRGASGEPEKSRGEVDPVIAQALGKSWQALAELLCEAGLRAVEAALSHPSNALVTLEQAQNGSEDGPELREWKVLKSLLDSRAWWWGRAVFDARVQAWFLRDGQKGPFPACAMTIVSELMLGKHSALEEMLKRNSLQGPVGKWAQARLKIASEVRQKL